MEMLPKIYILNVTTGLLRTRDEISGQNLHK